MATPYTYPTTLQLELLSVLTTQPRRWIRLPFPAKINYSRRPVEDVFESDTSRLFITRRAPDAIDLSLDLDSGQIGRDVMEQIEELRRMNVPVYVYPRWPGTTQYLWPLRRNVAGDPASATYTGTIGTDTTMYMVRGSASRGVFLEAVDPSNPVILPGIYTGEHIESHFPLGQGVGIFAPRKNEVKNSLFGDITAYVPANWTAAGGTPGTDQGVLTTSWIGTPALWLWGQSNNWISDAISITAGKRMAVSFAWKCDGVIKVKLEYNSGTNVDIALGPGAGYYQAQHVSPPGATTVQIVVCNSTGSTYGEFAAPQILCGASNNDATPYFLGGTGTGVLAGLMQCRARVASLDIEPHLGYSAGGSFEGYGLTAISGYFQPCWEENFGANYGIAALTNSRNGKTIGCEMSKQAGDPWMYLRTTQDGGVESSQTVSHTRGDTYAFCLYCGQKSVLDTIVLGVKAAKVGTPGTIYTSESTSGIYRSTCFDGVRIGETDTDDTGLDGIVGGYCVHSIQYADIASLLGLMAHPAYTDLWRATIGKQYRILPNLSPSPWQRQYWGGAGTSPSIELTQYREL
jgi:hypothetical protein